MRLWTLWWSSVTLCWGMIVIAACTQQVSPVSSFCPQPIHPDPVTRAWLMSLTPPPEAIHYFKLIGDEQKIIKEACGK